MAAGQREDEHDIMRARVCLISSSVQGALVSPDWHNTSLAHRPEGYIDYVLGMARLECRFETDTSQNEDHEVWFHQGD